MSDIDFEVVGVEGAGDVVVLAGAGVLVVVA